MRGQGNLPPILMPIYEYHCEQCGCFESAMRPMSECASGLGCFNCGAPMMRVYSPPALLGRSKPRPWKFDPSTVNGWDSRLAAMRKAESEGAGAARQARANWGKAWDMAIKYKKEKYA